MARQIPTLDKLYTFKEDLFNRLRIERPVRFMVSLGVTPNLISTINLFVGAFAIFYLFDNQFLFVVFYVANRLIDILDGYVARKFNLKTEIGDKLDHFGDLGVSIGLFLKTIFFSDLTIIAAIALLIYITEYILLKKENMLSKKFPSAIFSYFFVFGIYKFGIIYQIIYQVGSYAYFQLRLKDK